MLRPHGNGVTITTNTSVLVAAVLTWGLALKHLAVLGNAVALALGDAVLAVQRLTLRRCPGEVVATYLNVIVCKLAKLVIVHTQKFSFLRSAKVQAGNLVDDEGEDRADDEGVYGAGDNIGNLLVDGRCGAGDGTTGQTVVDAIKADDVICAEDTVEEESPHSSDAVLSEDIERIVNADPELDYEVIRA